MATLFDDFDVSDSAQNSMQKTAVLVVPFTNQSSGSTPPVGRLCSPAEEELKQFAGLLSLLKKITGYLRKVTTLWASVVLAGFSIYSSPRDFWFATVVVFLNYRMDILTRKYENEEDTTTSASVQLQRSKGCISKMRQFRGDMYHKLSPRLFPLHRIIIMFIMIAKFAGAVCIPVTGKAYQSYKGENKFDPCENEHNMTYALILFYKLVTCECVFFLVGDAYYLCSVYCCRQLHKLSMKLGFDQLEPIQGFLNESIASDNLGRDMVTYGVDLLASYSHSKHLIGTQILKVFLTKFPEDFSGEVLINIGANLSAMKTLVEMIKLRKCLKYEKEQEGEEKESMESAAMVLAHLAKESENSLRIYSILGSIRAISALFEWNYKTKEYAIDLGLLIIEELAHDQGHCEKIGKTKDLLDKLVSLTKDSSYENISSQERSLKVLRLLTSPKGATWKILRREISESTRLIDNIRDILSQPENTKLHKLGINVLSNLAAEKYAKERVGDIPGVLESLVGIFFCNEEKELRICAGKALQQLARKSKGNCLRILRLNLNERFTFALMEESLRGFSLIAAQVLLYLCTYGRANHRLQSLLDCTLQMVLKGIVDEDVEVQDVMVGIAAFGFKYITKIEDWIKLCDSAVICNATLGRKLHQILMRHKYEVSRKKPNVCNAVVEVVLWMINIDVSNVNVFKELGIGDELKEVVEITPKMEEVLVHLV